jgi:hypothetical protein
MYGRLNSTDIMSFAITADVKAPTVTNQTEIENVGNTTDNMIGAGNSITLSAQCRDETLLKEALLATNESGTWENISALGILDEITAHVDFEWQNAAVAASASIGNQVFMGSFTPKAYIGIVLVGAEKIVGWKIYCIDFSGNVAETPVLEFKVKIFDEVDVNQNGKIDVEELTGLTGAIKKWKTGQYNLTKLIQAVSRWKAGGY